MCWSVFSIDSPKALSRPKPSRYSSVRARIQVRRGRPVMHGFANVGAVFGDSKKEELHPQIIRMARRSGQLNLSNKGLAVGVCHRDQILLYIPEVQNKFGYKVSLH